MTAQIIPHTKQLHSELQQKCSFCNTNKKPFIKSQHSNDLICYKCVERFKQVISEQPTLA